MLCTSILALALIAQAPAATLWQATDATGQTWTCPDRASLIAHVETINARVSGQPRASGQAPAQAASSGGGGVHAWLNAYRARHGRGPLAYDAYQSNLATANSSRGMGHSVGGYGRGQVSGYVGSAESGWEASPAHASILLDPYATSFGVGVAGNVITININ